MSLGLTSVLYGFLCCPSFYVTWSHFRSVWVSMLSEFLCHLVSLPFCMYLYGDLVSMTLDFISVLYVESQTRQDPYIMEARSNDIETQTTQ
jgi:hypothetical protein